MNIENLSKEHKKKKKREYGKNRYHMSEEKKQEFKEYEKGRYHKAKESMNNNE